MNINANLISTHNTYKSIVKQIFKQAKNLKTNELIEISPLTLADKNHLITQINKENQTNKTKVVILRKPDSLVIKKKI